MLKHQANPLRRGLLDASNNGYHGFFIKTTGKALNLFRNKFYNPTFFRIQSIVNPNCNSGTGEEFRTTLANDNLAGVNFLAAKNFHAQSFGATVSA